MGKIKEGYFEGIEITQEEIAEELLMRSDADYQYQEWLKSEDFLNQVNHEVGKTTPKYSEYDVLDALCYASEQITITPSEVGKEVYETLFSEKVSEYLDIQPQVK